MNLEQQKALDAFLRQKNDEKLRFFVPNGRQEEFINLVGHGEHTIYILSTGNGLGKTALVVNILGNLMWPGMNKGWFKGKLFDNWSYPKRARIATETKNVEEIGAIDEEIRTWWPKGRWKSTKEGKLYQSLFTTDTGWIMDKMTYQQEAKEFESATLGLAIFDEPPPRNILMATRARMRRGGIILISMTPLSESAYIYEEVVDSPGVAVIYGSMEDNCKTHGVRGILEHENIQKALDGMDPDEIEARRDGKPMHFHNSIFGRAFDRKVHVLPNETEPPVGSQFGMTIDPADGKPYAIVWWWVDPRGHIVIDHEWPEDDWVKSIRLKPQLPRMSDYISIFQKYEQGRRMEWRIMDRHFGNNRNVRTGKTLIEDWEDLHGVSFMPSYNCEREMDVGIMKVLDYLKYDRSRPLDSGNIPRLYVKERCPNTIKAMEKWARKVDPSTLVAAPDPKSAYKDFCDVVRYTCMKQPEIYISRPLAPKNYGYVLGH